MMKTELTERRIEECAEQLLAVLDKDIEYLEDNIAQLNELRRLVVRQDTDSLGQLLAALQAGSKTYQDNISKRQMLRKKLAVMMNCSFEETTLTRIEAQLNDGKNRDVAKRKSRLRTLTARLQKEYVSTRRLLADCARFNRLLLKSIFETGQSDNITYNSTGARQRQTDTVFMNLEF